MDRGAEVNPRNSKLTEGQVREIRARYEALPRHGNGRTHWGAIKQLASDMSLPYRIVHNVILGRIQKKVGNGYDLPAAMNLMLRLLQSGKAGFYEPTGEFRFGGLMYSARDGDWCGIMDVIGWDRAREALANKLEAA
jgi:hypothetical protein